VKIPAIQLPACAATSIAALQPGVKGERAPAPTMIEEVRFAADSPLEGDGFELLVPQHESPRFPKHPGTIAVPTV